jgi:protein gp37
MGETKIQWTDVSWNPIRGCSRVSAGCDNCYAIREAHRHSAPGRPYEGLTEIRNERIDWTGIVRPVRKKLVEPFGWKNPRRVFVNSMSDLFHPSLPDEEIDRVFAVIAMCQYYGLGHIFQILTKRPTRMHAYARGFSMDRLDAAARELPVRSWDDLHNLKWPLENVWLGVSVEDESSAVERLPLLLKTPAKIRFASYEPAIGPVCFTPWLQRTSFKTCPVCLYGTNSGELRCPNDGAVLGPDIALDWIIVGGESGANARPFDVQWARAVIRQCAAAGVACFVKQLGDDVRDRSDAGFDGASRSEWPGHIDWTERVEFSPNGFREEYQGAPVRVHLPAAKGGDPSEWPADLRVREWPQSNTAVRT